MKVWSPTFSPPSPLRTHQLTLDGKANLIYSMWKQRQRSLNREGEGIGKEVDSTKTFENNENRTACSVSSSAIDQQAISLFDGNVSISMATYLNTDRGISSAVSKESNRKETLHDKKTPLTSINSKTNPRSSSQSVLSSSGSSTSARRAPIQSTLVKTSQPHKKELQCLVQTPPSTTFQPQDLRGIERFCRYASTDRMQALLDMSLRSGMLALVFFWATGISTHSVTSIKLCTPSKPCHAWNCSCERNIRSMLASTPPDGVLILLGGTTTPSYFLPLGSAGSKSCLISLYYYQALLVGLLFTSFSIVK